MSETQHAPQSDTAQFEREFEMESKPSTDLPAWAEGAPPPDPQTIVYSEADKPDLFTQEDEPKAPLTKEQEEANEFGKEQIVEMLIEGADALLSEQCANLSGDKDADSWTADEKEKANLKRAGMNFANAQNVQLSPGNALVLTAAIIYLPRFILALRQGNELKRQRMEIRRNKANIAEAINSPAISEVRERTNFRIYANGMYLKNNAGQAETIADAKTRPNFNNRAEIEQVLAVNGLSKVKNAYPAFAELLEEIESVRKAV